MHGLHACFFSVAKMPLKGEVGGPAFNSHGKTWSCGFEFLWEPCKVTVLHDALKQNCTKGSTPLKKRASRALDKNHF